MKKNEKKEVKKADSKSKKVQVVETKKTKPQNMVKPEPKKEEKIEKNPIKRILERAVKEKKETKSVLKKSMSQFAVIGLGRFGMKVALTLANDGNEVLAIDINERNIREIQNYVAGTAIADSTGTNVLKQLGIKNFDCVIVCIGEDLQASILTTLICKDLGVHLIVAKANSEEHKEVLERIGADVVVFPEDYTGQKVAKMLSNPSVNEVMKLTDKFKIVEIAIPDSWQNKSIVEIDVRRKYHVSIIVIKRDDYVIYPEPETELKKGDVLLVAGEPKRIEEITKYSTDVIDVVHTLSNGLSLD